jgi:hypothetical protein
MENNGYERPYNSDQLDNDADEVSRTLNNVFLGSLDEYSPRYEEPLDLPLYPHQRATIAAMLAREHGLRNGLPTTEGTQLFGRYAILGDGPATGKSWTAVSYIKAAASKNTLNKAAYLHQLSDTNFFSIRTLAATPTRHQTNLIVIPTGLLSEWIELLSQIDIRHLIVRRKKTIDSDDFLEKCAAVDVVIVPHTIYAHFYARTRAASFRFIRAFVDDWASIPLNGAMTIDAEFTWLLTPSWYYLMFEHTYSNIERRATYASASPNIQHFLRRVFNDDDEEGMEFSANPSSRSIFNAYTSRHEDRHHLIVRCSDHFIKESIGLIEPKSVSCSYTGDSIMKVIVSMSSRAVQEPLAERRFQRVFEMIGATTLTTAEWEQKRPHLLRRQVPMDQCPICFDALTMPTLTNCCQNFFCAECLFKSCQSRGNQSCPMCRGLLQGLRLTVIDDGAKEETPHPKKVDVLIDQLRSRSKGSNLIYFPAEPMYGLLRNVLRAAEISFDVLMGNHIVQKQKLDLFRKGGINNLIVFDRRPLLHKDMSHVSTIFIYPDIINRTDKDRLIYLTQRIGRTEPLEVVEFISEN